MSELADRMHGRLKKSSSDVFIFLLKALSGLVLALTFALVVHEILGKSEQENLLSFVFILVVFTGIFLRIAKNWSLTGILIFDLICILIGIVLRLYIMIAPGS